MARLSFFRIACFSASATLLGFSAAADSALLDPSVAAAYAAAGMFETGLTADMPKDADCPPISLHFGAPLTDGSAERVKKWGAVHAGIDWIVPLGTPIVAIADGRVVTLDDDLSKGPGNHVVIRHKSDISSSYTHLSGFNVALHDTVKRGQVIGYVGRSGTGVTRVQLHLNIYGPTRINVEGRTWRYRYDYLQYLSGDMTPIDPAAPRRQAVPVAYIDQAGHIHPPDAAVIWPFACAQK